MFVCGCARSGTTALCQLVGSHPRVLLGVERYAKLARDAFLIEPEHLEPSRFARIEDGDTYYDSLDRRHRWDEHFREKLAGRLPLAYVGDKKPMLYRFWREIFERFPDARLLFIYRDPLEVAYSWERRARVPGGNWPPKRDARAAIAEWNTAASCIREALAEQQGIAVLSYEHFLSRGWVDRIFSWLELPVTDEVAAAAKHLWEAHNQALLKRSEGEALELDLDEEPLRAAVDRDSLRWLEAARRA